MNQTKSENAASADVTAEYLVSAPEVLWQIGFFPLTNTFLSAVIISMSMSIWAILFGRRLTFVPTRFQAFFELFFDFVYNITNSLAKSKTVAFFPWLMTFVMFILIANLSGLLPGFSSIVLIKELDGEEIFIPLFRAVNSDLNMTLGLSVVSILVTHYFSIRHIGLKAYMQKWLSLKMFGAALFIGLLEFVSEITKVMSLSFRLYGNILAGKVLLKMAKSAFPFFLPLPFYLMEVMVSFIQAAVFMMLTLVFLILLSRKSEH